MQGLIKPNEYENEVLDEEDPDSMYFIYICTKQEDMVTKKLIKENKIKADLKKKKPKKMAAPNL